MQGVQDVMPVCVQEKTRAGSSCWVFQGPFMPSMLLLSAQLPHVFSGRLCHQCCRYLVSCWMHATVVPLDLAAGSVPVHEMHVLVTVGVATPCIRSQKILNSVACAV
jgi:hypothetical protein